VNVDSIALASTDTTARLVFSNPGSGYVEASLQGPQFHAHRRAWLYNDGDGIHRLLDAACHGLADGRWSSAEGEVALRVLAAGEDVIDIEVAVARETDVNDTWELRCVLTLATVELRNSLPRWLDFQARALRPTTSIPAEAAAGELTGENWGSELAENLNRNVMAEHEADLAALPPEVRASRTPEEWLATPTLEILKLVREGRERK
jgi:hypothetical protein